MVIEQYFKKLILFDKIIFCLGWLSIFNLLFWIIVIITASYYSDSEKLWNNKTLGIVYTFGWINLFILAISFFIWFLIAL